MSAKRVDANQGEVVEALRAAGATVAITSELGHGFPDILVGFRATVPWILAQTTPLRVSLPMEIKTARGRLTPDELRWHAAWGGSLVIVRSPLEALAAIGAIAQPIGRLEANPAQMKRR